MEMQKQGVKVDLFLARSALSRTNMMILKLLCLVISLTIAANSTPNLIAEEAKKHLQKERAELEPQLLKPEVLKETWKKLMTINDKSSNEYKSIIANLKYAALGEALRKFKTFSNDPIKNWDLEGAFDYLFLLHHQYYKYVKFGNDQQEKRRFAHIFDENYDVRKEQQTFCALVLVRNALKNQEQQAKAKLKQQ